MELKNRRLLKPPKHSAQVKKCFVLFSPKKGGPKPKTMCTMYPTRYY